MVSGHFGGGRRHRGRRRQGRGQLGPQDGERPGGIGRVADTRSRTCRLVNPSLIPSSQLFGKAGGPLQPSFPFNGENYWTQSLFLGVHFHC